MEDRRGLLPEVIIDAQLEPTLFCENKENIVLIGLTASTAETIEGTFSTLGR